MITIAVKENLMKCNTKLSSWREGSHRNLHDTAPDELGGKYELALENTDVVERGLCPMEV